MQSYWRADNTVALVMCIKCWAAVIAVMRGRLISPSGWARGSREKTLYNALLCVRPRVCVVGCSAGAFDGNAVCWLNNKLEGSAPVSLAVPVIAYEKFMKMFACAEVL